MDANVQFFDQSKITEDLRSYSKIKQYFPDALIKLFYYYTLSYELGDNNRKAELYEEIMKYFFGNKFQKLGTGTNRVAFRRGWFVFKIALDRRGYIDNLVEAKRSVEAPNFLALTYETNGLIAVSEYVNLLSADDFMKYQYQILELLSELAKRYIFGDMGYTKKNYCNFGMRSRMDYKKQRVYNSFVVLDYAYMHPRYGNEEALVCPNCGGKIEYNAMYTAFKCRQCGTDYSYLDIKRRLNTDFENIYLSEVSNMELPDLEDLTFTLDGEIGKELLQETADLGEKVPIRRSKIHPDM